MNLRDILKINQTQMAIVTWSSVHEQSRTGTYKDRKWINDYQWLEEEGTGEGTTW